MAKRLWDQRQVKLAGRQSELLAVAFLDVLGFGEKVVNDYENTLQLYDELVSNWKDQCLETISMSIYSDAIIMSSPNPFMLVSAVNCLHFVTLLNDCILRGAIAWGRHLEVHHGKNTYIVSEPLTHAVHLEKRIRRPCVTFHESLGVPPHLWTPARYNIERAIIHFDGISLVNPFNVVWLRSAVGRLSMLAKRYPQHAEKYEWLIRLGDCVRQNDPLVPPEFVESCPNTEKMGGSDPNTNESSRSEDKNEER